MVASLYFHVPFCTKKCPYCHFFVLKSSENLISTYQKALYLEWLQKKHLLKGRSIRSIYFGGGTPSQLPPSFYQGWIDRLSKELVIEPNCEITLEMNPEDVHNHEIADYKQAGINRISFGVQSFDNALLQSLQRTHNAQQALSAITHTYNQGIDNITIDLMYDLPNQPLSTWKDSVDQVKDLPITHLSLYNLTLEPGSAFFKRRASIEKALPSEETSRDMLEYALDRFEEFGLERYEISAFAKEGKQSIHNTGYWQGRDFLGLGPSAFSYWEQSRFQNVCNLNKYHQALKKDTSPVDFSEKLPSYRRTTELLLVGLRMFEGVDIKSFSKKFGTLQEDTLKQLAQFKEMGFLTWKQQRIQITKKGSFFYDSIAEALL